MNLILGVVCFFSTLGLIAQIENPKQVCLNAVIVRDSTIYMGDLSQCNDFKDENTEPYGFVLEFINDVIGVRAKSVIPNVFPGPPIASKEIIDSLHITNPINGQLAREIFFSPETGTSYGGTTIYTLPHRLDYKYIPFQMPREIRSDIISNLNRIKNFGMYQKFPRNSEMVLPFFVATDEFASYVQYYNLEDTSILNSLDLGINLGSETPRKIWVECYIPVDSDWLPVGIPSRDVRPIAIETDSNLYLYTQVIVPSFANGGSTDHYEGKVFDLSKSKDINTSLDKVLKIFNEELKKQFISFPLSCIYKPGIVPNQIRFQRHYDKSNVLKGFEGPYYELSTYTIILWTGPSTGFLGSSLEYQSQDYLKNNHANDQVYLQVNQCLQISVGHAGQKYIEPRPDQYAAYRKVILTAIEKAVKNTTTRLKGEFSNNIGIIK